MSTGRHVPKQSSAMRAGAAAVRTLLRVEWRHGGYYVVGAGIDPIPVDSRTEGLAEIAELERSR